MLQTRRPPKSSQSQASVGAGLIVVSSFFYASYGIWTTLLGGFFTGYVVSALRSALVLLILIPIGLVTHRLGRFYIRRDAKYFVGLILSAAFIWGPLYYSILHAGVGVSLAINYISIVLGMFLFGWLLVGERLTRIKVLAGGVGVIGLILIFIPDISGPGWLALAAAVVSGISNAIHTVIAKKIPYNSAQSTVAVWTASLIANTGMATVLHERLPMAGWHVEWAILGVFAAASVVSSWSAIAGIKRIDAGTAGILGLLEIVFGVIFGVVFFAERPSGMVLAGVIVVIAAAALPYTLRKQPVPTLP